MNIPISAHPDPHFYTTGGTLNTEDPSYVSRFADGQLLDAIKDHRFCYVLTPRQMGKSSLMVRTAKRLQEIGGRTAIIDLTAIGAKNLPAESWYLGQIAAFSKQLKLSVRYESWWKQKSKLGSVQRFVEFLSEVVIARMKGSVTIFVDEIDTTLNLPFSDDYFAAIRSMYNARSMQPELERLNFVLLGVASPTDLIKDSSRTPFNIGVRIELTDFSPEEAGQLARRLAPEPDAAQKLLDQVIFWTGGHPYLTQKTCERVARWSRSEWRPSDVPLVVDDLVRELFLIDASRNQDSNLHFISDNVTRSSDSGKLLELYRYIRNGSPIIDDDLDPLRMNLKLSGLVKVGEKGLLRVRNLIYERVFDENWIQASLGEKEKTRTVGKEFRYDAFVSYNHQDAKWVREFLIPNLERAGLRIAADYRDFRLGMPLILEIERAVEDSRYTIVILSPAYLASDWTSLEEVIVETFDPAVRQRRLLPIVLSRTELPARLAILTYLDFSDPEIRVSALRRLIQTLGGKQIEPIPEVPEHEKEEPRYDTGAIREMLLEAFNSDRSEDLSAFIYDFYPALHSEIIPASDQRQTIQTLIEYMNRSNSFKPLLNYLATVNPRLYRKYEDRVRKLQ